jgi:hypothetical protein
MDLSPDGHFLFQDNNTTYNSVQISYCFNHIYFSELSEGFEALIGLNADGPAIWGGCFTRPSNPATCPGALVSNLSRIEGNNLPIALSVSWAGFYLS